MVQDSKKLNYNVQVRIKEIIQFEDLKVGPFKCLTKNVCVMAKLEACGNILKI